MRDKDKEQETIDKDKSKRWRAGDESNRWRVGSVRMEGGSAVKGESVIDGKKRR